MSDTSQGEGWWIASDNKWYPPEQHPDYTPLPLPEPVKPAPPSYTAETVAIPAATPAEPAPLVNPAATPAEPAPLVNPAAAAQPSPSANPGPTFAPAGAATQTYAPDVGTDPDYNLPATADPSSSKRGLILGVGALVLIAGLGFLGFRFFTGASAAGGADSPEAAIEQLIASINERDAVGFVDVFDPDEIEAWVGSFSSASAKFESIDGQGASTNDLSEAYESVFESFNYTLTGPGGDPFTYEVEPLDNAGRISRVRVGGLDFELIVGEADSALIVAIGDDPTAVDLGEFDGTGLELRDEQRGLAARLLLPGEPAESEFSQDLHLDLVTVQKDGKWFVSVGYTFLELARGQGGFSGMPLPDYGRAFSLVDDQTGGAESPEQVVQTMFTAIETLDYDTLIQLTDPYGTPYLHDYQPLIDAEVDEADRQAAVSDANLRFDDLELGTSTWEGRTLVTTQDIAGTADGGFFSIDTTSWCVTIEDQFDRQQECLEDGIAELLFELDSDLAPRDFIPEQTGFIVVERNGRWYLDPLGTMGFYLDQIAETAALITEDFDGNAASEIGDFFLVEGPFARQGSPARTQAASGSAGVALDLSDYPQVSSDFADFHVAVARVVTDQPGSFVSYDNVPLTGEDWIVVYDSVGDGFDSPAIAVNTDGSLDVELFEVQVTEVGTDGFSGQLGGQGRPQVLVFGDDTLGADITVEGASAETVFGWESNGVLLNRQNGRFFIGDGAFTVIYGEPGASFTIDVDLFEPEPEPEPTPAPEPEPDPFGTSDFFDDPIAGAFAGLVENDGYSFDSTQAGGFFDGCGGPDDPDVTSYIFQGNGNMVLTPYPTAGRAEAAFDSLVNVVTPCNAFGDIEITGITTIDSSNILIEWEFADEPDSTVYEHYRLAGDTVVVATNTSAVDLERQLTILDGW